MSELPKEKHDGTQHATQQAADEGEHDAEGEGTKKPKRLVLDWRIHKDIGTTKLMRITN